MPFCPSPTRVTPHLCTYLPTACTAYTLPAAGGDGSESADYLDSEESKYIVKHRADWQADLSAEEITDFSKEELAELSLALDELEEDIIARRTSKVLGGGRAVGEPRRRSLVSALRQRLAQRSSRNVLQ